MIFFFKLFKIILTFYHDQGQQAQVTQALRTIKTHRRYGLTGTALQNNMREIWSILDWSV